MLSLVRVHYALSYEQNSLGGSSPTVGQCNQLSPKELYSSLQERHLNSIVLCGSMSSSYWELSVTRTQFLCFVYWLPSSYALFSFAVILTSLHRLNPLAVLKEVFENICQPYNFVFEIQHRFEIQNRFEGQL